MSRNIHSAKIETDKFGVERINIEEKEEKKSAKEEALKKAEEDEEIFNRKEDEPSSTRTTPHENINTEKKEEQTEANDEALTKADLELGDPDIKEDVIVRVKDALEKVGQKVERRDDKKTGAKAILESGEKNEERIQEKITDTHIGCWGDEEIRKMIQTTAKGWELRSTG